MSHFLILRPMRFPGGWGRHRTVNMYMYNNSMVMTNTRFDMDAVRPLRAIISHPEMSEVTQKCDNSSSPLQPLAVESYMKIR